MTFMEKISRKIEKFFATFIPDAFPLALVLLIVTMAAARLLTGSTITEILGIASSGVVSLWGFSMQIMGALLFGYCFANSPPVKKALTAAAKAMGENPRRVVFLTGLLCNVIMYINAGIGTLASAIIADEVIKNNKRVRPGIVVAVSYAGYCAHCLGISPAIFASVATPGHQFENIMGVIPVSETTFYFPNIVIAVVLILGIPALLAALQPKEYPNPLYNPGSALHTAEEVVVGKDPTSSEVFEYRSSKFVRFFEAGRIFSSVAGLILAVGVVFWFKLYGGVLSLDTIAVISFGLALIGWGSVENFAECAKEGVQSLYAVAIAFPIYGAIMSIMTKTGLSTLISETFVSFSNKDTLPLFSFWAAGLVNIFVPSAGGQWAVQAPSMIPAATALGTSYNKIVTAVALGDCWTNMIQPFWALPILSITKVKCREMLSFTFLVTVFEFIVVSLVMLFLYPIF